MILINKPKFDTRKMIGKTLKNGIKYVLINDESLEKSFVSVSVNVGSFSNPTDFNGLAHFLEHMLFMGSKKYTNESHFEEILKTHGGSCNAYTGAYETVYLFNVLNSSSQKDINILTTILDIFSRFFIDPLFDIAYYPSSL